MAQSNESGVEFWWEFADYGAVASSYRGTPLADVEGIIAVRVADHDIVAVRERKRVPMRAKQTMLPSVGGVPVAYALKSADCGRFDREAAIAELLSWPGVIGELFGEAAGCQVARYIAMPIREHLVYMRERARLARGAERFSARIDAIPDAILDSYRSGSARERLTLMDDLVRMVVAAAKAA